MPKPRTTELPFADARLVIFGADFGTMDGGTGGGGVGGGGAGSATTGTGAGVGGGGAMIASGSFPALAPFFLAGFLPFPCRTGAWRGSGPFANVSFTRATSASDIKGFSIVATTFLYFRAVAAISATWPDIITIGTRAV